MSKGLKVSVKTCEMCGEKFKGYNTSRYCEDCKIEAKKAKSQRKNMRFKSVRYKYGNEKVSTSLGFLDGVNQYIKDGKYSYTPKKNLRAPAHSKKTIRVAGGTKLS